MTDNWNWNDVESIIRDLKIDGYEVVELESSTSNPVPEKEFLLRVRRVEE